MLYGLGCLKNEQNEIHKMQARLWCKRAGTQASYIDDVSILTDKTERKTEERLFENGARQNRLFENVTCAARDLGHVTI